VSANGKRESKKTTAAQNHFPCAAIEKAVL